MDSHIPTPIYPPSFTPVQVAPVPLTPLFLTPIPPIGHQMICLIKHDLNVGLVKKFGGSALTDLEIMFLQLYLD